MVCRATRGFTMVEALAVIGVIALITGAVLSMLTQASHTYAATVMNGVAQREASSITDLVSGDHDQP